MAQSGQKVERLIIGSGDITVTSGTSTWTAGTAAPSNSDGADGDGYIRSSGVLSDIYLKRNGVWNSLLGTPLSVTLANNTTATAFQFPFAVFPSMTVEYTVTRGTNIRQGTLKVLNDGLTAVLNDGNINDLGAGNVGVNFSASISGSNVDISYTSDNQPGPTITLQYTLRGY